MPPPTSGLRAAFGTGTLEGEQIVKTNADAWQSAGITGAGVKVGIMDHFDQAAYNSARAGGEIPAYSGTPICRDNGAVCNIFAGGTKHGIGVAEAIADMAPGAALYFGSATTAADAQQVLQYFDSQGVDIVTRSETGRYDGPGNGTGTIANVIQTEAVAKGMFYLNAAGNSAGRNGSTGSYVRAPWRDSDNDGCMEWDAGGDELLGWNCAYQNGLRWNDFGEGDADHRLRPLCLQQLGAADGRSRRTRRAGPGPPRRSSSLRAALPARSNYVGVFRLRDQRGRHERHPRVRDERGRCRALPEPVQRRRADGGPEQPRRGGGRRDRSGDGHDDRRLQLGGPDQRLARRSPTSPRPPA